MEKPDKHKESDPILLAGQANENNDSFWSQSTIQELNRTALVISSSFSTNSVGEAIRCENQPKTLRLCSHFVHYFLHVSLTELLFIFIKTRKTKHEVNSIALFSVKRFYKADNLCPSFLCSLVLNSGSCICSARWSTLPLSYPAQSIFKIVVITFSFVWYSTVLLTRSFPIIFQSKKRLLYGQTQ